MLAVLYISFPSPFLRAIELQQYLSAIKNLYAFLAFSCIFMAIKSNAYILHPILCPLIFYNIVQKQQIFCLLGQCVTRSLGRLPGQYLACFAIIKVRIQQQQIDFEKQAYLTQLLRDCQTSSNIGEMSNGLLIYFSFLQLTPDVAQSPLQPARN